MKNIAPLISSGTAGPLGVLHLPRLWLKLLLESAGRLAAGYPGAGKGFDQMVIDGLGLKREAVVEFVTGQRPTYPQFEAWVKQNATQLDKGSIDRLNDAIRGYNHDDATRRAVLSENGIPDDSSAPRDAIQLNNLDDWKEFHDALSKSGGG